MNVSRAQLLILCLLAVGAIVALVWESGILDEIGTALVCDHTGCVEL